MPLIVRRCSLLTVFLLVSCVAIGEERSQTDWAVLSAKGLDALLLLGAASGDPLQAEHHAEAVDWVRDRMSQEGLDALDGIHRVAREERQIPAGPLMALLFSAGSITSLDEVMESARNPEAIMRPAFEASEHWEDEDQWSSFREVIDYALIGLEELDAMHFGSWYAEVHAKKVNLAVEENREILADYDLIREQQRLLGRPLDARLTVFVVRFAQPYGIRILGQQFITDFSYPKRFHLRVAAHEMFHPPFDMSDQTMWDALSDLESSDWVQAILEHSNPDYGYTSFQALVNEGSAQALDQIVAERLGFAQLPGERWREADGGMHMLAAAFYHAMSEDGFDESGGVYGEWLRGAIERGLLSPETARQRAVEIVGHKVLDSWESKGVAPSGAGAQQSAERFELEVGEGVVVRGQVDLPERAGESPAPAVVMVGGRRLYLTLTCLETAGFLRRRA